MVKLTNFRRLITWAWIMFCPVMSQAEVSFDKITACEDIARLYKSMKNGTFMENDGCRLPHNKLEKELVARSGIKASDFCFTEINPAPFLKDFSCFTYNNEKSHSLDCFRAVDEDDIEFYKDHYKEKFAARESKYLSDAKACPASNGDSARATNTLLPISLQFISSFEFGFISQLGKSDPSDSAVVHGYAKTDPEIDSDVPPALEFVSIFTGSPEYEDNSKRETIGNWNLSIDEADKADSELNKEFRHKRIPIRLDLTTYKVTEDQATGVTDDQKLELTEELLYAIAKVLKDEGFKRLTDSDLQDATGMDSNEMIDEISQRMPYGLRKNSSIKMGRKFLVFENENRPVCTRGRAGTMGVYLISFQPTPEVKSDFGELGVFIGGFGECSRFKSSTDTYMEELNELVKDQILRTLKHE